MADQRKLNSSPTMKTVDTDLTLATDELTIDANSTLETNPSSLETPRSASTPTAMNREDRVERAKEWCAELESYLEDNKNRGLVPGVCASDLKWEVLDSEQKVRAMRLVSSDFSWSPGKPLKNPERYTTTFTTEFDRFLERATIPWRTATYKFKGIFYRSLFFEEEDIEKYMVIRRQRAGICSLHASVVFQHYLECYRNETENHSTFDISRYISGTAKHPEQIQYLLTGNLGVKADDFFLRITRCHEALFIDYTSAAVNKDDEYMETYKNWALKFYSDEYRGPVLLCGFAVGDTFNSANVSQVTYEGRESNHRQSVEGITKTHAMVVIGMYVKDDGKLWFLVQNTWKDCYFQEISAEYLASCGGRLRFVHKSADISLREDPAKIDDVYGEAASPISEGDDALEEKSCDGSDYYCCNYDYDYDNNYDDCCDLSYHESYDNDGCDY